MKIQKIRKTLATALAAGNALQIRRRHCGFNEYGYPVGIAEEWVLFHAIEADVMTLNGYMAVRIKDIEKVRPDTDFLMRALSALGESPIRQPDIILADLPSLLQSANEKFPLLNIHLEVRRPEECYVGRIARVGKNKIHLWSISPKARWWNSTYKYSYEEITLVEFGDGYVNALWMLGQQEWLIRSESIQDERNSP
jgi:hypothetical protein